MAQPLIPTSDVSAGSWTPSTGSTLYETIDEESASDSDFARSEDDPSLSVCEIGLSTVTDPESSADHDVNYRYQKGETGGGQPGAIDLRVRLLQGTTEIAVNTHSDIATGFVDGSFTLTVGEADSITDYSDLRIEFRADKSSGARTSWAEVSWARPTVPDAVTTIEPSGIPSAEAFGAASVALELSPTGIPSADGFGTPTVTAEQLILPGGIPSGEAFGTPAAALEVSPTGIASAEAFGTPVVGDPVLSSPAVKTNGVQLTLSVSSGAWSSITVDPSKITIAITSEGYDASGNLTTIVRTATVVSAVHAAGVFTCELTEPIHDDDTSITFAAQKGAFNDGIDQNAALTATAATNNSTLDYARTVLKAWTPQELRLATAPFKVYATGAGSAYADVPGELGIRRATLTINDGTNTEVYSQPTMVYRTSHPYGLRPKTPAWEFTVDPNSRPSSPGNPYEAGVPTMTVAFEPMVGDEGSRKTISVLAPNFDPAGAYVTHDAWFDTSADLEMQASVSAFGGWKYVKGTTSLATGILVGTQSGTALHLTVLDGTFGLNETITEYDDSQFASSTGVTGTTHASTGIVQNGDDATGTVDDDTKPFRSEQAAGRACQNAHGSSASHCTLHAVDGAVRAGPYSAGQAISTPTGAPIIRPASTATSEGAESDTTRFLGMEGSEQPGDLAAAYDGDGLRVTNLIVENFRGMQRVSNAFVATAAGTGGGSESLSLQNLTIYGEGLGVGVGFWDSTFEQQHAHGVFLSSCENGIHGHLAVDCTVMNFAEDAFGATIDAAAVNCRVEGDRFGGAHNGTWQLSGTVSNVQCWCCGSRNGDGLNAPFTSQGAGATIDGALQYGCDWQGVDQSETQIDFATVDSYFVYQIAARSLFRFDNSSGAFIGTNIRVVNSAFIELSLAGTLTAADVPALTYRNNHSVAPAADNLYGTEGADGGDTEWQTLFADFDGENFRPTDSDLLDRWTASEKICSLTADGKAIDAGNAGFIGPIDGNLEIEPSGIPSAEAFGTPAVGSGEAIDLTGQGIPSAEAFGVPSVSLMIEPSGIPSGEAFGAPTVGETTIDLDGQGIPSGEAFGTPHIALELNPSGVPSGEQLGTPSVEQEITVVGIPSEETSGMPHVSLSIGATGIPSAEQFGAPSVSQEIEVSGIASAEAFGTAAVALEISPPGIPSAEAFGTPTVIADQAIFPSGIPSGEAFGVPTVTGGAQANPYLPGAQLKPFARGPHV